MVTVKAGVSDYVTISTFNYVHVNFDSKMFYFIKLKKWINKVTCMLICPLSHCHPWEKLFLIENEDVTQAHQFFIITIRGELALLDRNCE